MAIEVMVALLFAIIVAIGIMFGVVLVIRIQDKVDKLEKQVAGMSCYLADLRKKEILPSLHECNEYDEDE